MAMTADRTGKPREDLDTNDEDLPKIPDVDIANESAPENGDLRPDEGDPHGELPEEDDDNPYQNSDEALPDDEEEKVISRNPSKEGGLFDEA
jgi:hypothetical protein